MLIPRFLEAVLARGLTVLDLNQRFEVSCRNGAGSSVSQQKADYPGATPRFTHRQIVLHKDGPDTMAVTLRYIPLDELMEKSCMLSYSQRKRCNRDATLRSHIQGDLSYTLKLKIDAQKQCQGESSTVHVLIYFSKDQTTFSDMWR